MRKVRQTKTRRYVPVQPTGSLWQVILLVSLLAVATGWAVLLNSVLDDAVDNRRDTFGKYDFAPFLVLFVASALLVWASHILEDTRRHARLLSETVRLANHIYTLHQDATFRKNAVVKFRGCGKVDLVCSKPDISLAIDCLTLSTVVIACTGRVDDDEYDVVSALLLEDIPQLPKMLITVSQKTAAGCTAPAYALTSLVTQTIDADTPAGHTVSGLCNSLWLAATELDGKESSTDAAWRFAGAVALFVLANPAILWLTQGTLMLVSSAVVNTVVLIAAVLVWTNRNPAKYPTTTCRISTEAREIVADMASAQSCGKDSGIQVELFCRF